MTDSTSCKKCGNSVLYCICPETIQDISFEQVKVQPKKELSPREDLRAKHQAIADEIFGK